LQAIGLLFGASVRRVPLRLDVAVLHNTRRVEVMDGGLSLPVSTACLLGDAIVDDWAVEVRFKVAPAAVVNWGYRNAERGPYVQLDHLGGLLGSTSRASGRDILPNLVTPSITAEQGGWWTYSRGELDSERSLSWRRREVSSTCHEHPEGFWSRRRCRLQSRRCLHHCGPWCQIDNWNFNSRVFAEFPRLRVFCDNVSQTSFHQGDETLAPPYPSPTSSGMLHPGGETVTNGLDPAGKAGDLDQLLIAL
jgi:hypothetical protein